MKELWLTEPQLRKLAIISDFTNNYLKYRLAEKNGQTYFDLTNEILIKIEATPRNKAITDAKTVETILAAYDELNKVKKLLIVSDAEFELILRMVNGKIGQLQRESSNEFHQELIAEYKELLTVLNNIR